MRGAVMTETEAHAVEKWERAEREKRERTPVDRLPCEHRIPLVHALARATAAVTEADELLHAAVPISYVGDDPPEGTLEFLSLQLMFATEALCRLGSQLREVRP
jgi:hypothetical protein